MDDISEGLVDLKLPSILKEQSTCSASAEDVISDLRSAFDVALQVEDVKLENFEDSPPLCSNGCSNIRMTTMSEKCRASEHVKATSKVPPAHSVKCLCKSATFPLTGCISSTSTDKIDNKDNQQEDASFIRAASLPVVQKLVSAMKGGREKEGMSVRKLSVSWAPDVYDPPPSSVSHLPKRNNQSYRNNKKYSKGKQKSKNSQGSRKKDKKHHRKGSEKAESSIELTFATNTRKSLSSNYRPTMELQDFDNGDERDSPDSNCGSSFLRKSCGTLHLPYAETT